MNSRILKLFLILAPFYFLPTQAAVFNVTSAADQSDANPGDGICLDVSGNCTLRAAIQECNALGGNHSINLPIGTYTLSGAANEDACQSGDLDINSNIDLIGTDTRNTIIDANFVDRVIHVLFGGEINITLIGLSNGQIDHYNGGGIYNDGICNLDQVSINNCESKGSDGSSGLLLGGGLGGAVYNNSNFTANKTLFRGNIAQGGIGQNGVSPGGGGGGGGSAGMGGAFFNETAANATFTNCTMANNSATGGKGGNGSHHNSSGTVESNGGYGAGNGSVGGSIPGGSATGTAGFGGGGGGGASLSGAGNNGGFGGGGGAGGANSWGGVSGPSGNGGMFGGNGSNGCCSESSGGGGGAGLGGAIFNNEGNIILNSCSVGFNNAIGGVGGSSPWGGIAGSGQGVGAGLFNYLSGNISIENTVVASNTSSDGDNDLYGNINSLGHNLVLDLGSAILSPVIGSDLLTQDPLFLPLDNLGGFTDVLPFQCGSPLVNNGESDQSLDQLCLPRPLGSEDEIGAFESNGGGNGGTPGLITN